MDRFCLGYISSGSFPWFVEVCGARSCTQDGRSAWSRERHLWNWGQRKELTECSLPCLREKASSGRRGAAGLVWFFGLRRLGWKARGEKCNLHKGYGGIMPCYCLWQRCDLVLLQIRDNGAWGWVGAGGGGWGWGLDISVSCCERGSGSQGTVQFPLLWGCNMLILHESQYEFRWKLSMQSLSALWNRENGNLECWAATGLRDVLVKLHLAMGKTCL